MKKNATRLLIALLVSSLLLPVQAQPLPAPALAASAPAPTEGGDSEEVQPKFFIWGLVLNIALKFGMSAFSEWRARRNSDDPDRSINYGKLLLSSSTAGIVSTAGGAVGALFGFKSVGATENTVADLPTKPIVVQNGQPNYQGVHVAILGFDRAGEIKGLQPVTAGFRSGDRIKLKLLSTFDALVVIDNINPQGVRKQIYPPNPNEAVSIKAGSDVVLPLGARQFFEFAGVTGDEQLVITVRDPRAAGEAESKVPVSRQDERDGSSFVQETAPGTYPVIAQSLKLRHER